MIPRGEAALLILPLQGEVAGAKRPTEVVRLFRRRRDPAPLAHGASRPSRPAEPGRAGEESGALGRPRRIIGRLAATLVLGCVVSVGSAESSFAQTSVLPPKRPASLLVAPARSYPEVTGSTRTLSEAPVVLAAGGDPPDRAVLERANATLNGITTLTADFAQTGGDGRRLAGTLYLQRPGKLRFEYDAPATLEVVSDGSTVLVRDRKLNTADPYPLSQTPLKFLLSSKIDLAREATFKGIARDGDGVRISIEDSSTLGGTSKITLTFDAELTTLKRWRVIDPQGYTTTVSLSNHERNRPIDPKTFMLNYSRPVN